MNHMEKLKSHIETASRDTELTIKTNPDIAKIFSRNKLIIDGTMQLSPNDCVVVRMSSGDFSQKQLATITAKLNKAFKDLNLNYAIFNVGMLWDNKLVSRILIGDGFSQIVTGRPKVLDLLQRRYIAR